MISFTVTTRFRPEDHAFIQLFINHATKAEARFRPEDHAFIQQIMVPLTEASRQEPGCVNYIPHWLRDEPDTLLIYEQYTDQSAVDAHRTTPHFAEYVTDGLDRKLLSREYIWLDALL